MKVTDLYTYSSFILQFQQAKDEAEKLISALDEYTFLKRPEQDTWCIAECFSHLINFGKIYLDTIQRGYDTHAPSKTGDSPDFPPRIYWKWIIAWFEPPYNIKVKTFSPFEPDPVSGYTRYQVLENFTDLQERFITQLKQANQQGHDLGNVYVNNPIFSFVKMTLSECYAVTSAHQRRHIWQARQILRMLNSA